MRFAGVSLLTMLLVVFHPVAHSKFARLTRGAKPVLILHDANQPVLSADGRRIVVTPEIGVTEVFDFPSGRKLRTFRNKNSVGSWISADGSQVIVFAFPQSANDDNVWFYDTESGTELKSTNTYLEYEGKFAGRLVVYGGDAESTNNISSDLRWIAGPASYPVNDLGPLKDKQKPGVWLWNIAQHQLARSFGMFEIHDEFDYDVWQQVKLTPDGHTLAASRTNRKRPDNQETIVWDAQTGRQLLRLPFGSYWLAVSDKGQRLVTSRVQSDEGSTKVFGITPEGQVTSASEPGTSSTKKDLSQITEVWDIASGRRLSEVGVEFGINRPSMVRGALSPDGKLIVTASLDEVLVWDAETGRLLAAQPHVQSGPDRVKSVAFSSNGRYLVMSSVGEVVKVWLVADVLKEASASGKSVEGLR